MKVFFQKQKKTKLKRKKIQPLSLQIVNVNTIYLKRKKQTNTLIEWEKEIFVILTIV